MLAAYILCLYFVYVVSSYFNFFHHPIISDVGRIVMNVKMSARADSLDSSLQCQRFESSHLYISWHIIHNKPKAAVVQCSF